MTKIYTAVKAVSCCGNCPNMLDKAWEQHPQWTFANKKDRCFGNQHRIIKDIRGDIPSWCPLPDKKEEAK